MVTAPAKSSIALVHASVLAAADVHGARPADALAARAAERQGGVLLVLDLDQPVEHHRPAGLEVDVIAVDARVVAVVRVPAVDAELLQPLAPCGFGHALPSVILEFFGSVNWTMIFMPTEADCVCPTIGYKSAQCGLSRSIRFTFHCRGHSSSSFRAGSPPSRHRRLHSRPTRNAIARCEPLHQSLTMLPKSPGEIAW
jgi:hypothetical protein